MKPYFPTEELREENDRLIELFLSIQEDVDVDEFIEENASDEYRHFIQEEEKRKEDLFKKGIII